MKIEFIKDFMTNAYDIKAGEVYDVIKKKEPDKWVKYVRYQIRLLHVNAYINVPEMFVEEIV